MRLPNLRLVTAMLLLGLAIAMALRAPAAQADPRRPLRGHELTDRIIVKWRDSGVTAVQIASIGARAQRLAAATGVPLRPLRNVHGGLDVMRLAQPLKGSALRAVIARLQSDPGVQYAEPDERRYIQAVPNDPRFVAGSDAVGSWSGQWYLLPSSSTTPAAISATTAWDTTMGSANVIVAVVDSGVQFDHEDLLRAADGGKLYNGYDFVSCDQGASTDNNNYATSTCSASGSAATYELANDSDGWDADPSDPGDWLDSTDLANTAVQDAGCTATAPSTWHGTRVAGLIGALTNNGIGIAGAAPNTMILPVRAIGKCTGYVSDIVAAMRWAAGLPVTGAPANPNPAQIINVSLGAAQPCSATEQAAVNDIIDQGVLIVASAGNEGGPVDAPANCNGVLSVAGIRHSGSKVGFSNLSSAAATVGIAAPGGNCVNLGSKTAPYFVSPEAPCVYSIETLTNAGATTPAAGSFYTYALFNSDYASFTTNGDNVANVGTSFAAPLVSAVAALMLATNSQLTPAQLIAHLESSALAFPTTSSTATKACTLAQTTTDTDGNYTDTAQNTECLCSTATCGAGMLNAFNAVHSVVDATVIINSSTDSAGPGDTVRLDGSASSAAVGRSIVSYQWSSSSGVAIANANQAVASFVFPAFRSITVTLTITDNAGTTTQASKVVLSSAAAASGGGGGAFGPDLLVLLATLAGWCIRRRYQDRRFLN